MIKKTVRYKDFNDQDVEEDLYFNLSKTEIVEMHTGGLVGVMTQLIQPGANNDEILSTFKHIIGLGYGIKSDDGRRFRKDKTQTEDFLSSPAYDALFMELVTGQDAEAIKFILGMLPADMHDEAQKLADTAAAKVDTGSWKTPETVSITNVPLRITAKTPEDDVPAAFRKKQEVVIPDAPADGPTVDDLRAELARRRMQAPPKPLSEMTDAELELELSKRSVHYPPLTK